MSNLNPATHPEDAAQVLQSCLPLRNPVDDSPAGSSVIGILQARILEWVTISFSRGPSLPRYWTLSLFSLLHWQVGSLQLHHHPKCTRHWVAFWCFFIWGIGNTHRKNYRTSNFRLRKGDWGNSRPQGSRSWGTPDLGTPRLAGTLRTREHPQGCRASRAPPACRSSGRLCLLHSVPRSPGLGRAGPPQPLSAAGDELGVPPAAFTGFGGQSWHLQRELRKPPVGIFKENTLEQQLLDSCTRWAHSAPSLWSSQPSNLGGVCGWDLWPGKTCLGHPPLICMDYYHLLSVLFWSHSTRDPRGFADDSEAPAGEFRTWWGHVPPLASPFHPMPFIHTCSSRSSSSPKTSHKAFLKKMSREFSDIWKEEISQAAPIPPRAGKHPYGVAQGSADFMGPVEMCGSRLTDSSLNSCSGHSWWQSQVQGCRHEVRSEDDAKKVEEEGCRQIS